MVIFPADLPDVLAWENVPCRSSAVSFTMDGLNMEQHGRLPRCFEAKDMAL